MSSLDYGYIDFDKYIHQLSMVGIDGEFSLPNIETLDYELTIPLLDNNYIRKKLTLTQYLIFLIIFEQNNQGYIFSETNNYFVQLLGIKESIVEKSLRKLLELDLIIKTDLRMMLVRINQGKLERCLVNSLKPEHFDAGIVKMLKIKNLDKNLYRNFIVNLDKITDNKESFKDIYYLSEEERKLNSTNKKNRTILQQKYKTSLSILLVMGIDKLTILNLKDENYKKEHQTEWINLNNVLKNAKIEFQSLYEYLESTN